MYMYKEDLALNNQQCLIYHKTKSYTYLIYVYKEDLALNNQQCLMYHKIKSNQN